MISKQKFTGLNIKQKIYKITSTIRECEKQASEKGIFDTENLNSYIKFMKEENHPKITKTLEIIEKHLSKIKDGDSISVKIKAYNLCFHELLDLLEKPVKEEYFENTKVKIFDRKNEKRIFDTVMILDNIRSPFNVGSMFRTSDCLGIKELALCGITPKPPQPKIDRTSMNTVDIVSWRYFQETEDAIKFYKNEGYEIYAVETATNSVPLFEIGNFDKKVLIFGNEEFGITEEIISLCNKVIEIPLMGIKNSMNVSNAFAIVSYEIMKKGISKDFKS